MESTNKARTPSRCREWERQRRNKFNEAIVTLGDVVKEIIRADSDSGGTDVENVQYPKIEIVHKAIVCLKNCMQEKTKLKAEILALQVRLDTAKQSKKYGKDASTQVFFGKKNQRSKYLKVVKLQTLQEKPAITINPKLKSEPVIKNLKATVAKSLPKLLPRSDLKKSLESTIVVLPAAQYIFPQRPLLLPAAPPAIVLVDSSLQTFNKLPLNRSNGDVTRTTMVNILPISAYSRPLSATKNRKNNSKLKDGGKKQVKKPKVYVTVTEPAANKVVNKNELEKKIPQKTNVESIKVKEKSVESLQSDILLAKQSEIPNEDDVTSCSKEKNTVSKKEQSITNSTTCNSSSSTCKVTDTKQKETTPACETKADQLVVEKPIIITAPSSVVKSLNHIETTKAHVKYDKTSIEKVPLNGDKDKDNKLPHILDTALCDTVVDAGNACLELAEELLADSPKTAAYLMSFPLVSGNRADSPAEEPQNAVPTNYKESNPKRNDVAVQPTIPTQYFDKTNASQPKLKSSDKSHLHSTVSAKPNETLKFTQSNQIPKQIDSKTSNATTIASNENPFLNLPMPSLISNSGTTDTSFGLDFDCNISKSIQNQPTNYVSSNNFFYKSDPFSTVKNTIYSTSNISSSHDFNSLGLYPCAMEKYTSKTKTDYSNVEENLMKMGSSRLTYDIDLGWSHKSFDFVNCTTTANTFCKDNILTTVSAPYATTYNPFNPDFHVPLVSNHSRKENISTKSTTSFADTITSFYSQPTNLWSEDVPFYTNNNISKSIPPKHQNYLSFESLQTNNTTKVIDKHYDNKRTTEAAVVNSMKSSNIAVEQQIPEKFTKKSPSKMHINWMTSEIRPMENNCNPAPLENKDSHKTSYSQIGHAVKKQDNNESYFPITMHNFVAQPAQEEFQMWPTRQVGPTEISIEPPPINLPTLVGDLALGPHDKKKNTDIANRAITHTQDIQNCGNFLSVTQLMNRSSDNMSSRYQATNIEVPKINSTKPIPPTYFSNDLHRKTMNSRLESQLPQPCYGFNDAKTVNSYESMAQFSQNKNKTNKSEKNSKTQKSNYSAEALIRGGGCTQKIQDIGSNAKFMMPSQKYNEFNTQDNTIAQVSHFPPMLDYTDNSYASQQFSGTTLYNSTTNTISNSFYSNFMPGSSNLMSSNYTGGPFPGDFIDYNQTDCNYTSHKYEELKMRNNPAVFPQEKVPSNYKSSRRESAAKHKLECSKKDTNKKYQSKRAKLNTEVEEWGDPSHLLWQNKAQSKKNTNLVPEELSFPNYAGNQVPTQYQPEFFNSHLMPSNVQTVGHNVDRSISFPATSRANFNLSSIFPEITMKVQ